MAENLAEDDDDEMFGDFKFVSYPNSNQDNKENDDDWGDFIATPTSQKQDLFGYSPQSQPAYGFSVTQNPTNSFEFSHNFNPQHYVSDDSIKHVELKLNHVESSKNLGSPSSARWEKPKGALPLSLFGDEEEETDAAADQSTNEVQEPFSSKSVNNGSKVGSGVNFNDLIVNLYSQNGSTSNLMENANGKAEKIQNGLDSNLTENLSGITPNNVENGSMPNLVEENGGFDEEDWEFKDAAPENGGVDNNFVMKKDENVFDSWMIAGAPATSTTPTLTVTTPTQPTESKIQECSEGSMFGFSNNVQHDGDWFVGNFCNPTIIDNGFHSESGVSTPKFWDSDTLSRPKQIETENGNNTHLVNESFDSDESFDDFKDASKASNYTFEQKEELKVADQASPEMKGPSVNDDFQGNGKAPVNNWGALPLSIFSNGKLDPEESLFGQDVFSFKPTISVRNGINSQMSSSSLSLNDLISDLYSQAENIPAVNSTSEDSGNGFSSAQTGLNSNLANVEDDFDESSWDFKAAVSETKAECSSPVVGLGHIHQKLPTESNITSFVDFYTILKEQSGFIALHHLKDLKNAEKFAVLSGENAKAEALHEEIQAASMRLPQDSHLEDRAPRNISVNELLAAMEQPKFQVLESEYHLSQRISLAEQNLRSAIELYEHSVSVLRILNLGCREDVSNYATAWSKIVSTCARELNHGASIWKQSLQENVHNQILSKTQGQRYIIALSEVYRVIEVMRVSTTFFKPWILSSLVNPMDIFAALEECDSVWWKSGMDEALRSLSDPVGIGYDESTKELLESINFIRGLHDIDTLSPQNTVPLPEQTCRLSLLSLEIVPEMKIITWNGEHYFLTLANLWANLISRDPPKLPHVPVHS